MNFMTSPIAGMMIQSDELHHFSEGWLSHQLDKVNREALSELQIRNQCSWNFRIHSVQVGHHSGVNFRCKFAAKKG